MKNGSMLAGRVAVVTGAGRGIGRAVAELFVREGARVAVNDVDAEEAEETVSRCRAIGGDACALSHGGSVTDREAARSLVEAAVREFGSLHILVNNAGVTRDAMAHRMTDEQWRTVLEVNLTGTFLCIRESSRYLREPAKLELLEHGEVRLHRKIVNVASTAAIRGNPGQINYTAAKMGTIGLTRTLAREWAPFRINVNAVAPGFTDTRLTRALEESSDGLGVPAAKREEFLKSLPFGRPAHAEEIARVILFFASPLSDWVTGQVLNVSGGHQIP
jgi:3-oxoacyl-[acyl-carrier protein] reductase